MLRRTPLFSVPLAAAALLAPPARASGPDGVIDPAFGTSNGRAVVGYLETDTPQLQAMAKAPSGRLWLFGDDAANRNKLVISRLLANGQPDTGFGPNSDGRRITALPANLIAQVQAWSVAGAIVQADGKPVVFGGFTPVNGEAGMFPALVCRLAVAGNFDASFGTSGCRKLYGFIANDETCRVTDLAQDSSGMLVAVGNCAGPTFTDQPFVARLTTAGALDPDFAGGLGMTQPGVPLVTVARQRYQSLAVLPDRRIDVLGDYVMTDTGTENIDLGVVQFDPGGSRDQGFGDHGIALLRYDLGGDNADHARDMVLQADGKLAILGQATRTAPARTSALLARLNGDGTPDNGFGSFGKASDDVAGELGPTSQLRSLDVDVQGRFVVAGQRSAAGPAITPQAGTDFWMAIPRAVPPESEPRLFISSDTPTSGVVRSAALAQEIPFGVVPGEITTVTLPLGVYMNNANDTVVTLGLHVTTQAPVTVTTLGGREFAYESYLALPTPALGTDYRVMAWDTGLGSGSQFLVTAAYDNTTLSIVPSAPIDEHPAGIAYPVTLQRGEAYRAFINSPGDVSGTRISADKPVAVVGGHTCALVPDAAVGNCDPVNEQLLPLPNWGLVHYTVPFAGRSAGDVIRVYAKENATQVWFNGVPAAMVDAGFFYETTRTTAQQVSSDKPVAVAQYAKGCSAESPPEACYGDPLMLTVLPTSQWASRYDAVVPPGLDSTYQHFLNLVVPGAGINDVRIDGVAVPAASFTEISIGTNHYAARIATTPGIRHVTAPEPISVGVYGFRADGSESYGHLASPATAGEGADADDVLLRFRTNGTRDADFGDDGAVFIDHAIAYGTALPAFDSGRRALVDGTGILVGSASNNGASAQDFFVGYRVTGDVIFRDDFE